MREETFIGDSNYDASLQLALHSLFKQN